MNIGDKVIYEGQVATVVNEVRPKCKCKGKGAGYYELNVEGFPNNHMHRVPLTTVLEPFMPLTMTNQKLNKHKLI
jgi:hypothetical protein